MRTQKSPSDLDRFIGERIRTARRAKGLSQTSLGEKLGLTFQQMQKYEKGSNRVTASRLDQIAEALGCPLLWLYGKDADVGVVPTASQRLADRIGQLRPEQQVAFEQLADVMLKALATEQPVTPAIPSEEPGRGRPRKDGLKAKDV